MKKIKQQSLRPCSGQAGFTLIEILLIIAIFTIVLSSAVSLSTTQIFESDLDAKILEVSNLVEVARNNSATGYKSSVWSIKVLDTNALCDASGDCVLLFKGNDFSGRDTNYDRFVQFDQDISGVSFASDQENEFYFDYKSGWLSTSTATRLEQQNIVLDNNFGEQKSVVIYPSGTTSTFTCGENEVFDVEGNGYSTVKIGSQCWMAENLNTGTMLADASTEPSDNDIIEKWCYDDDSANCDKVGGLYTAKELTLYAGSNNYTEQGICPGAWHPPTTVEVGVLGDDGYNLRIGGPSGFNLPFSGKVDRTLNVYSSITTLSTLGSSFENGSSIFFYIDDVVDADYLDFDIFDSALWGFAVRCIKDY